MSSDIHHTRSYTMTSKGEYCPASQSITSEADCRSAAAALGRTFATAFAGRNDHAYCLYCPGRRRVFFNTEGSTARATPRGGYASLCGEGIFPTSPHPTSLLLSSSLYCSPLLSSPTQLLTHSRCLLEEPLTNTVVTAVSLTVQCRVSDSAVPQILHQRVHPPMYRAPHRLTHQARHQAWHQPCHQLNQVDR